MDFHPTILKRMISVKFAGTPIRKRLIGANPSDDKTEIINKSTMSWPLNIDTGSSGM